MHIVEMERVILVRIVRLVQGIVGHVHNQYRRITVEIAFVIMEKHVHHVLEIVDHVHHLHQLR
jgi:hypothetical protein